jgi:copper homeostasis protein
MVGQHLLEIAIFKSSCALDAQNAGATRIELCENRAAGGTTPPLSEFLVLRDQKISIPIRVMIRIREGNFTYDEQEIEGMVNQIKQFEELDHPPEGYVFGCLSSTGLIDEGACARLIKESNKKPCTFHKAFDSLPISKLSEQIQIISSLGFSAILSSAGAPTAIEGVETLKIMQKKARECGIELIVGGGVRSSNLEKLTRELSGTNSWHSACVTHEETGEADATEVRRLKEILDRT